MQEKREGRALNGAQLWWSDSSIMTITCLLGAKPGAEGPTSTISVHTVKGVQMNGEAIGLPEALATVPADIWLVPGVGPHVAGQLDGLGKHSITVLACIHFAWRYT